MYSVISRYLMYGMAIVIAALGAYCGFLYLKCGNQEVKIAQLTLNYDTALIANAEGWKTVQALEAERTKAKKSCETRLAGYDATLAELKRISELQGGTHEQGGEVSVTGGSGDDLLDALNGMFPDLRGTDGSGPNGVCKTGSSGDPEGSAVLPGSVSYCFCSVEDVKNLLKDWVLTGAREKDLVNIIEGLR